VDQILARLAATADELVGEVVARARSLPAYAELDESQLADVADTVGKGLAAVLQAMREDRPLADAELAFLWAHIRRRTQAGVPEADMLAVVRLFQTVLWDAIVDMADDDTHREAALMLTRPLLSHVDTLSRAVDRAFAEADAARPRRGDMVLRDLVEDLLRGMPPSAGPALDLLRRSGLSGGCTLLVGTADAATGEKDGSGLLVARSALARAAGRGRSEPLAVVRDGEIVVIAAIDEGDLAGAVASLRDAVAGLAERQIGLALGISTLHEGAAEIPAAYREATLCRSRIRTASGVLALCELSVAEYLIIGEHNGIAWRLVPGNVRQFVASDSAGGGVLCETLLAYVDCDLSVKLAAERLFVHPNTAHYRLSRIEQRTGLSMRRLSDVQLLCTAIRLFRAGACG
jgi:PucR C-terminal helix-turn-helix domain/GGDEF-like domain